MIVPMLAVAIQGLTVVRLPDPEASSVTIQALVRLPKLSEPERLCIKAAWPTILEGSEEYGAPTLRNYLQQSGKPVMALALSDHLLLRITFPKEQMTTAAAMLESLLKRPLLEAEHLEKALQRLREPKKDAWAAALDPLAWREAKPSRNEILAVYRKLVRPENLTLAFGGAYDEDDVAKAVGRFSDWRPAPEQGYVRPWAASSSPMLKSPTATGALELAGPEFLSSDPSFPIHLLSATALGVGAGSAIHQVSREQKGWSYTQEGFLYPTPGGLRLRLIFLHAGDPPILETIDAFRAGLLEEIKGWTQADRQRAVNILRNWLLNGIGHSPIWLLPEGGLLETPDERTHLAAWWRMKFGSDMDAERLLGLVEQVSLDELKEAAASAVEKASARVLVPG